MTITQIVPPGPEAKRLGGLALFAALFTYVLILVGGIVRVTGSSLACGNTWPRCNGVWIPEFTAPVVLDYAHRALAAGLGLLVIFLIVYASKNRRVPGFSGPGGLRRPIMTGGFLLVLQGLLGAMAVRLELPPDLSYIHFMIALLFATTLLVAAVRAGTFGGVTVSASETQADARKVSRMALATSLFGLVVILLGSMTANTPGAPTACQGFPLCNGSMGPPAAGIPASHIHYGHRMLAYLLFFHVLGVGFAARRRAISQATRNAIVASQVAVVLQVAVAGAMVMMSLAPHWRAMHLATGVALWFALASWAALARRDMRAMRAVSPAEVPHYEAPAET